MRPSGGPKRPPKGPKGRPSGPNMAQRGFKPNVAQGGFPQDGSELGQDAFKRAPKQLQERLREHHCLPPTRRRHLTAPPCLLPATSLLLL